MPSVALSGDADESVLAKERVAVYLGLRAGAKPGLCARVAAQNGEKAAGGAILVADTSVVLGEEILGKPASDEDGLAMIERLAGARTRCTRFAIAQAEGAGAPVHAETVVTKVTFRGLSPGEGRAYVASGEGRDKAGGYAVQGLAMAFVARIEGSYTNGGAPGVARCWWRCARWASRVPVRAKARAATATAASRQALAARPRDVAAPRFPAPRTEVLRRAQRGGITEGTGTPWAWPDGAGDAVAHTRRGIRPSLRGGVPHRGSARSWGCG